MAYSGPTVVQAVSVDYSGLAGHTATQSPAFASTHTAGNSILVSIRYFGIATSTGMVISDLGGNVYTQVFSGGNSAGSKCCVSIWRADNIAATASNKVTVTSPTGASFGGFDAFETTPLGTVDQTGTLTNAVGGSFGPTVTTTANNELCIGAFADDGGFTWSVGTNIAWVHVGTGVNEGITESFGLEIAGSIQAKAQSGGTPKQVGIIATFPVFVPAGPISASITGTSAVTGALTATGALAAIILGSASETANLINTGLVSAITGSASVSANLVNIGLVASISGRASLTALLKALGPLNAGISGQASLSANLKARADLAATILGRAGVTADIIGFVVDQIRSDISGRGSVVAFPTIPPAKTYFPPNNPRGRQSPPYVLKEFGVTLSNPAYLATNQNTVQLFHQTSFVPNVNAGSVLPPRWSTPGTPDNQGYQGRAQAPGELLVAPDNLRLSGKVYTVVAQGMVFIPTSAVNPTFNLVMSQNYFRFGQAQVINTLFTLANPTSLVPGTMNGWTLIATLAGNGVSTPVISCAGRLWIGGTQYYGNGFSINPPETTSGKSHPSYRREPIVQLSLGVQFGGQVSGSDMFQAFLGKFQMGYNTNNNSF